MKFTLNWSLRLGCNHGTDSIILCVAMNIQKRIIIKKEMEEAMRILGVWYW
jgi:hypothetical protein